MFTSVVLGRGEVLEGILIPGRLEGRGLDWVPEDEPWTPGGVRVVPSWGWRRWRESH